MGHPLFLKSQALLEFIGAKPLRAQLVTYLSENFSLSGDTCAVGVIQLARDGSLHCIESSGFIEHDPKAVRIHDINSTRPTSTVVREQKLRILPPEQMKAFLKFLPEADRKHWISGVAIPVGPQFMYFFFLREDATVIDDYFDFISMVASLLFRFEVELGENSRRVKGKWFEEGPTELTERESQIEKFIREGLTNAQIASELGYSESLIRQETISIYRKMGVSGRKELTGKKTRAQKARRDVIRAVIAIAGLEVLAPLLTHLPFTPNNFS